MASSMSMNMNMVFTNSHKTALFSNSWTPSSEATYALTCIFVLVLGIISRCIAAFARVHDRRALDAALQRRYVRVAGSSDAMPYSDTVADGESGEKQNREQEDKQNEGILTVKGVDSSVKVLSAKRAGVGAQPWRLSVEVPRAGIYVLQAGVLYLLMIVVMTMNVGYFMSALAGLFVGELAIGRYATAHAH